MSNWIIFIQASLLEQKRSYNLLEYKRVYLFKNGLIKWFAKNHTANFEKSQSRIQFIASKLYALSAKVQFSCSVMSNSLRPPVHHQLPEFTPTHVHWVGVGEHRRRHILERNHTGSIKDPFKKYIFDRIMLFWQAKKLIKMHLKMY